MYIDLKIKNPTEGETIWAGVDANPMNPKLAIYKKGKFWEANDNNIELFPTHWKYPSNDGKILAKNLNISDAMNSDFSLTLTKQELIKLITESYVEGFDKGGKTSHDLLKKGRFEGDNVKTRNNFIKSKLIELKFG